MHSSQRQLKRGWRSGVGEVMGKGHAYQAAGMNGGEARREVRIAIIGVTRLTVD